MVYYVNVVDKVVDKQLGDLLDTRYPNSSTCFDGLGVAMIPWRMFLNKLLRAFDRMVAILRDLLSCPAFVDVHPESLDGFIERLSRDFFGDSDDFLRLQMIRDILLGKLAPRKYVGLSDAEIRSLPYTHTPRFLLRLHPSVAFQ